MFGRKKEEIERLKLVIENRDAGLKNLVKVVQKKDGQIRELVDSHQELQDATRININSQVANAFNEIYDCVDFLTRIGIETDLIFDALDRYLYGDGERETAELKLHEPR